MSTAEQLKQIEARANAATEGPWRMWKDDGDRRGGAVETAWSHDADGADTDLITDWCSPVDAEFIAAARTDIPRLTSALAAVLAVAEQMCVDGCARHDQELEDLAHAIKDAAATELDGGAS